MRLTLRTLLAYLDDTLDPSETKLIGQKVAESDAAQELIARIKQVTRRRRLTTPPATGPNSFEPNTVADYLDNTLSPEQVAEVEKACLESDVHLAEIAAAHQILTLVLGQPALVPPTAKQRMYALVHGRKAARPRAAAAATPNGAADADARAEEDETLLLGLPLYRRHAAMRWLLPLAGVVLFVALGLAVWHRLPSFGTSNSNGTQVANNDNNNSSTQPAPPDSKKEDTPKESGTKPDTQPVTNPGGGSTNPGSGDSGTIGGSLGGPDPSTHPGTPVERPGKPSEVRHPVAKVTSVKYGALLTRDADSGAWQKIKLDAPVSSRDLVVSLPGFVSDLQLGNDVKLSLWGSLYEFASRYLDSAVRLYAPPKGFDADFTLDRGAVLIRNGNAKSKVRIRFDREIWDVELEEPNTEVGMMIRGGYTTAYGSGEPPTFFAVLVVRKGRALARFSPFEEPLRLHSVANGPDSIPIVVLWDNKTGGPPTALLPDKALRQQIGIFDPLPLDDFPKDLKEVAVRAQTALKVLEKSLGGPDPIEATLAALIPKEPALSPDAAMRARVAVRCLGAVDAVGDLVNLLDSSEYPPDLRDEAIVTLKNWIGRNADQEAILYDPKTRTGVLGKGFSSVDSPREPPAAAIFMELLHSPTLQQYNSAPYWSYLIGNLNHAKLAIRQLAFFYLRIMLPDLAKKIPYRPNDSEDMRKKGFDEWKKLVDEGKLPPRRPQG